MAAYPLPQFVQLDICKLELTERPALRPVQTARWRHAGKGFSTGTGGVAPGCERGAAGLTAERLDLLSTTVLAIADQRVDVSIRDVKIHALLIGSSEAGSRYALGRSPPAFDLAPGAHRRRCWPSSRRGSGGETTGGAIVWAAGLQQTVERAALGCSS